MLAIEAEQPFLIRAHHLTRGYNFFKAALSSDEEMEQYTEYMVNSVLELMRGNDERLISSDPEYVKDVLGKKPADYLPSYKRKILKFATDFRNLADSYPVHITNGKDGICNACALGKHCDKDKKEVEHSEMEDLIGNARWLGLEEGRDYSVVLENTRMIRIETTKKIVADIAISTDNYLGSLPK